MNDQLFFKVYRNIFLNDYIFKFIKNDKINLESCLYLNINQFTLGYILSSNRKLFEIVFKSYLYNKEKGNENNEIINDQSWFFNEDLNHYLFKSEIIKIEEFIIIYNDFEKKYFSKDRKKVIKDCIQNEKNGKEFLNYLINNKYYKVNSNYLEDYLFLMCENPNLSNIDHFKYVFELFVNNEKKNNKKPQNKEKKERLEKLENAEKLVLDIKLLNSCIKTKKVEYYKSIFDLTIDSLVDKNGNDINEKSQNFRNYRGQAISKRLYLIGNILTFGAIELAKLYVERFPNQICLDQDKLHLSYIPDEDRGIQAYTILVQNGTLKPNHFYYDGISFIERVSFKYFKTLLEIKNKNMGQPTTCTSSLINRDIQCVSDLETLMYLISIKDEIIPHPLTFDSKRLLQSAAGMHNFEMFKFLIESPLFKAIPIDYAHSYFTNTSFEIVKYCVDNFSNYIFKDTSFECAFSGDIEYAKYIVDGYNNDSSRFQLTYRAIDRMAINGSHIILQYLLENCQPKLQISRDAINDAVKSGNLKVVELLKNQVITKKGDIPLLYESTIDYIYRNDRPDLLLSLNSSSIYHYILLKNLKPLDTYTPMKIKKVLEILK